MSDFLQQLEVLKKNTVLELKKTPQNTQLKPDKLNVISIFIPPNDSVWHFCEKIKHSSSSCF